MQDVSSSSSSDASHEGTEGTGVIVVAALVLVALAVPKIMSSSDEGRSESSGDASLQVDAVVVQLGTVTDQIRTSGTIQADESVVLTSETAGRITDIRFEEGSRVNEGELLVDIDDAELQAEKKRLEYRHQLASEQAQRQERLLERGGVSQEEYDATVNEVNVLESQLERVEVQIERTNVRAPFTGVVGLREVSEGSYVSSQTEITTLRRIDPVKINLSVSEKYSSRVREGQPITFQVRGSDRSYEGRVYASDSQVDPSTRTLQLRARAPNPEGRLRPGMFADVTLHLGSVNDAIVVPAFSIVPTFEGQRVFVVEDGSAQPRTVQLGARTDSTVQVTAGLSPQDTVITSGIQELRAGRPVQVNVSN